MLLRDTVHAGTYLPAERSFNHCPERFDWIELATVCRQISYCEMLVEQLMDLLRMMSPVIVYNHMRLHYALSNTCCYSLHEELERYWVGWRRSHEYCLLQARANCPVQCYSTESSIADWNLDSFGFVTPRSTITHVEVERSLVYVDQRSLLLQQSTQMQREVLTLLS